MCMRCTTMLQLVTLPKSQAVQNLHHKVLEFSVSERKVFRRNMEIVQTLLLFLHFCRFESVNWVWHGLINLRSLMSRTTTSIVKCGSYFKGLHKTHQTRISFMEISRSSFDFTAKRFQTLKQSISFFVLNHFANVFLS